MSDDTEYYNEMNEYEEYMQQQYHQQAWQIQEDAYDMNNELNMLGILHEIPEYDQWSDSDASLDEYVYEDKQREKIKNELINTNNTKKSKFKPKEKKQIDGVPDWDGLYDMIQITEKLLPSMKSGMSNHRTKKQYNKLKKELYKYKINQENKKLNRLRFNEVITELKYLPGGEIERKMAERFELHRELFNLIFK